MKMSLLRRLAFLLFTTVFFFACADKSCPENCIRITGFIKDSISGAGAANLPYEVYWVKKRMITKLDLIDTGSTDANGRIDKSFPIDKDRFKSQQIFVRVLPNENYRQAKGTIITQPIEEYKPTAVMNFTVLRTTELTIVIKPEPVESYANFLLTYNYDGDERKIYSDSTGLKQTEHKVRTATGLYTKVSAFTPTKGGVVRRTMDSIKCEPGKQNTIIINPAKLKSNTMFVKPS